MPEGGAAEQSLQLLGQNFSKPIFHKPKESFCSSQDSFYANSMLCCCFHRKVYTLPYYIFHGSFNIFQYSAWEILFLKAVGLKLTCSDGPRLSAPGLLISLSYSRVSSRKQTTVSHVGRFSFSTHRHLCQNRQCGCKAAQGKRTTPFPALPPSLF